LAVLQGDWHGSSSMKERAPSDSSETRMRPTMGARVDA
jgi:hypothetical protein